MSKVIELTDEQYQTIERTAHSRGQTVDALVAEIVADAIERLRDPRTEPRAYQTDDWLRHLGVSDETIRRIDAEIRDEAEMPYDADA